MSLAVIKVSYTGYRFEDIPLGSLNKIEASKVSSNACGYDDESILIFATVEVHHRSALQSDTCPDQSVLYHNLDQAPSAEHMD